MRSARVNGMNHHEEPGVNNMKNIVFPSLITHWFVQAFQLIFFAVFDSSWILHCVIQSSQCHAFWNVLTHCHALCCSIVDDNTLKRNTLDNLFNFWFNFLFSFVGLHNVFDLFCSHMTGWFGVPKSADVVSLGVFPKMTDFVCGDHLSSWHHLMTFSEQRDRCLCRSCFRHFGTFVFQVSQSFGQLNLLWQQLRDTQQVETRLHLRLTRNTQIHQEFRNWPQLCQAIPKGFTNYGRFLKRFINGKRLTIMNLFIWSSKSRFAKHCACCESVHKWQKGPHLWTDINQC